VSPRATAPVLVVIPVIPGPEYRKRQENEQEEEDEDEHKPHAEPAPSAAVVAAVVVRGDLSRCLGLGIGLDIRWKGLLAARVGWLVEFYVFETALGDIVGRWWLGRLPRVLLV